MRWGLVGWVLAVWVGVAEGQVLARRNWEGSGVKVQAWWVRGVFCDGGGDVRRVVEEMDTLERVGCDGVEVDPGGSDSQGVVEEMDRLIEAAGARRMRVVMDLDGSAGELSLRERSKFWGKRGVAGFAVRGGIAEVVGRLRQSAPGRLWIGEGGQLRVVQMPEGDAASVRAGLAGRLGTGVLLEDGRQGLTDVWAAIILLNGVAARIKVDALMARTTSQPEQAGREFSPEEMLLWVPKEQTSGAEMVEWVRRLVDLRRQSSALRSGSPIFLELDAIEVVAWTVAGRAGPTLVVCNLARKAVRVPVRAAGVKGSLVKTMLRSDGVTAGVIPLEEIGLGVGGVFVGDVR